MAEAINQLQPTGGRAGTFAGSEMDAERHTMNDAERQLTMTKRALDEADQRLGVMTTAKNTANQQLVQMTRKSEAELLAKDDATLQLAGMTTQMEGERRARDNALQNVYSRPPEEACALPCSHDQPLQRRWNSPS